MPPPSRLRPPTPRLGRALACAALFASFASATLGLTPAARAEGLSSDESARLARGETVSRQVTVEGEDRRYVGGITYAVVNASVSELQEIFEDVASYSHLLPRTKRATLVGQRGQDQLVELRQGNAVFDARYTLRVRHEPWRRDVRFWLDPTRPHDVRDAWGYFHVDPLPDLTGVAGSEQTGPRSLVTYGVLVDLGPGLIRELFEERLRAVLLSAPDVLRRYVALRRLTPRNG